jgi:Methane oxygenase PmoA
MRILFTFLFISLSVTVLSQKKNKGFSIAEKPTDKRTDVFFNDQLLTSYTYYDSVFKPALYPINTVSGITITREYPFRIKAGERADHPHHVGLFFTFESVNGLDFWNMSAAIKPKDRIRYGRIIHTRTLTAKASKDEAVLVTSANWNTSEGKTLLEELTTQKFIVSGNDLIIDRATELRAVADEVIFKDKKDALLGLRVARELELSTNTKTTFVKSDGTITQQSEINNEGANGNYRSSEGLEGENVWGTRAKWMKLSGVKDGKKISIAIIDHPKNIEYPTFWHARGYGLFAANPLGKEVFTNGKEKLNLTLKKDERVTLKYRIIIREEKELTDEELNRKAAEMNF